MGKKPVHRITRQQRDSRSVKKGYWVDDRALSTLKGFDETHELIHGGHLLSLEVRGVVERLFPYDVSGSHHSEPKFVVTYNPDAYLADALTDYLSNHPGLYQNAGQKQFFDGIASALVSDGAIYFAVDWDTLSFEAGDLVLPVDFRYLRTATMSVYQGTEDTNEYIQEYSSLGSLDYPGFENNKVKFAAHEVLYMDYISDSTPVKLAADLARKRWQ